MLTALFDITSVKCSTFFCSFGVRKTETVKGLPVVKAAVETLYGRKWNRTVPFCFVTFAYLEQRQVL